MGNLGLKDAGKALVIVAIGWFLVAHWWGAEDERDRREAVLMEEICRLHSPMCRY